MFGFGDFTSRDTNVFHFKEDGSECNGIDDALATYKTLAPRVRLAGPTTFGPLIRQAINHVINTRTYHVLLIVADGQVTRPAGLLPGVLSTFEEDTIQAIQQASFYPLSIVMVGVGDGPWDAMRHFDDNVPDREFDNFQFVQLDTTRLTKAAAAAAAAAGTAAYGARAAQLEALESKFAVEALQEVPDQWTEINHLGLFRFDTECVDPSELMDPLPPPKALPRAPGGSVSGPAGFAAYGASRSEPRRAARKSSRTALKLGYEAGTRTAPLQAQKREVSSDLEAHQAGTPKKTRVAYD